MRTASSNYNTYNALDNKNVVYAVEFYTLSATLDSKFVSGTFADIGSPPGSVSYKKYLSSVSYVAPRIEPFQSNILPGNVEIEIVDNDGELTDFLEANSIIKENIFIRFKAGFQEINYSDFVTFTNEGTIVQDVSLNADMLTYRITARDIMFGVLTAKINESAINDNYSLAADISAVETTTITILGTSATTIYADQSDLSNLVDTGTYLPVFVCVKVEDEIIQYSTVADGSPNSTLSTLRRSTFFTSGPAHTASSSLYVQRGIGFSVDPCRILLHLLTTKDGTNGKYDLGPTSGAKNWIFMDTPIDEDFINTQQIEQMGWKFHAWDIRDNSADGLDYHHFYQYDDPTSLIDHIIDELLKPFGYYLRVRAGKLEVGNSDYVDFIENFSSQFDFTASNVESFEGYEFSPTNEVFHKYVVTRRDKYGVSAEDNVLTHNTDAITYYPRNTLSRPFATDINLSGTLVTAADQYTIPRYLFGFYNEIYTIVRLRAKYSSLLVEPGDNVTLTLSSLPNLKTGSRGWSSVKGLVLGQEFDSASSEVSFEIAVFDHPHYISNLRSGHYSINKVTEGSITDKSLSVSTDVTATIEAADAYYDNTGTDYAADRIRFIFRLTPPGFGGGSDHEILKLKLVWLESGSIRSTAYREYIRFNPQSSTVFTFACDLLGRGATANDVPTEVKVDWVSTTATGSEIPTLELIELWFIKTKLT